MAGDDDVDDDGFGDIDEVVIVFVVITFGDWGGELLQKLVPLIDGDPLQGGELLRLVGLTGNWLETIDILDWPEEHEAGEFLAVGAIIRPGIEWISRFLSGTYLDSWLLFVSYFTGCCDKYVNGASFVCGKWWECEELWDNRGIP